MLKVAQNIAVILKDIARQHHSKDQPDVYIDERCLDRVKGIQERF